MSDGGTADPDAAGEIDPDRSIEDDAPDSSTEADASGATESAASSEPSMGIIEARRHAMAVASELLENDPESVIRAERTDRGWRVLVEVLERSAVPDTQDILGRYELVIDGDAVVEYGLTERYKRGDSRDEL
ncbi:gas vesicle protein [Natrinema longum]|uniref:Gas vesicle protein n=1 Tax=Natrinema longum TaxID=370324 RepID=A0A8A2U604_9EURY|nr:gas vesicle protein [Natrinema longum]MBZ6494594.1 gas vesicle protein [Natrinema longum]QSW84086.1 gas vesicle protein [Natrinema longum]